MSNTPAPAVSSALEALDPPATAACLQLILNTISSSSSSSIKENKNFDSNPIFSNNPIHHYLVSILNSNNISRSIANYTYRSPNLYKLIYSSEQCFENFRKPFIKVLNFANHRHQLTNDAQELLYQSLAYYLIGYTILLNYIPICLDKVSKATINEEDLELYGQLLNFYKNEFYFNNIRSEIEEYVNSTTKRSTTYFPRIKKKRSTKSYLTDYGPEHYEEDVNNNNNNNADTSNTFEDDNIEISYNSKLSLPSMSAKSLHKYLSTKNKNALIVDLRSRENFNTNHITNKFLINIDPQLLQEDSLTAESLEKTLRKILKSQGSNDLINSGEIDHNEDFITIKNTYNYFKQRYKFSLILYYTDSETWKLFNNDKMKFNYLQIFYDLIYKNEESNASKPKKLTKSPKLLEDGFESWVKFLENDYENHYLQNNFSENNDDLKYLNNAMEYQSLDPERNDNYNEYINNLDNHTPDTANFQDSLLYYRNNQEPEPPMDLPPPIPRKNSIIPQPKNDPPPVPAKVPLPLKKLKPRNGSNNISPRYINSKNNSPSAQQFPINHHYHHHHHHHQTRNNIPPLPSIPAPDNYGEPDQPNFPPPLPPQPPPPPPPQPSSSVVVSPYEAAKEQGKKRKPPVINIINNVPPIPNYSPINNGNPNSNSNNFQTLQTIQTPTLQPPQQASQIIAGAGNNRHRLRPKLPIPSQAPQISPSQANFNNKNIFKAYSIVGLKNYENNCYINSLLQCIFAIQNFRNFFLQGNYQRYNNVQRKPMTSQALSKLFDKMNAHGGVIIAPRNFLNVCSKLRPDFRIPYKQQDSTEFLIFLLDQLHEELNGSDAIINEFPETVIPALNYNDITEFETSSRLSINITDEEIRNYTKWFKKINDKNGVSPISVLFQGQLESCLKCVKCMKVSKTFANFSVLTLSIVEKTNKQKKIRLEDCIKLFTADEILSGENAWDCPNCKKQLEKLNDANTLYNSMYGETSTPPLPEVEEPHQKTFFNLRSKKNKKQPSSPFLEDSQVQNKEKYQSIQITGNKTIKSLKFLQLPKVLVISLSRFKFTKFGETLSKNTDAIIFPLILDIKVKDIILTYKLLGFINHYGNLKNGHYTSIVNKAKIGYKDCWCYFDDENYEVNINPGINYGDGTITSSDVYVLFYQQVSSVI